MAAIHDDMERLERAVRDCQALLVAAHDQATVAAQVRNPQHREALVGSVEHRLDEAIQSVAPVLESVGAASRAHFDRDRAALRHDQQQLGEAQEALRHEQQLLVEAREALQCQKAQADARDQKLLLKGAVLDMQEADLQRHAEKEGVVIAKLDELTDGALKTLADEVRSSRTEALAAIDVLGRKVDELPKVPEIAAGVEPAVIAVAFQLLEAQSFHTDRLSGEAAGSRAACLEAVDGLGRKVDSLPKVAEITAGIKPAMIDVAFELADAQSSHADRLSGEGSARVAGLTKAVQDSRTAVVGAIGKVPAKVTAVAETLEKVAGVEVKLDKLLTANKDLPGTLVFTQQDLAKPLQRKRRADEPAESIAKRRPGTSSD